MENICQAITFLQAKKILTDLHFGVFEHITDEFINEHHILSIAEKLGKEVIFRPIPNWDVFETGEIDILPIQLVDICFDGLKYQNEKLLIITIESYTSNKVFLVDFAHYEEFANTYEIYVGQNIDFVQPLDYIFFLLNQRIVVYINNEGAFTQIRFGDK